MVTFTCPNGGQEIIAITPDELAIKIGIHNARMHANGGRCRSSRQSVAPLRRAYENEGAYGVTENGSAA